MNKDVIYIDVDDDVTAIIGKIKSSKEKIVAIVPPKRAGSLQSAVNLRLLDRMAKNDKKQLVLITNNHALSGLAANAKIPVAKNLQSKPELAEIPALAVDDGDDIIDGSELPVGELAKTVKTSGTADATAKNLRSDAIDDIDAEGLSIDGEAVSTTAAGGVAATRRAQPVKKKSQKIPNFDTFRKKLIFIILGAVGLIALLIWMFAFAPAARVIITASTTPVPVSAAVKLGGAAASDFKSGVISSVSQTEKKDIKVDFTATGQKDLGETATGTVRFSTSSFGGLGTIPAGTKLTSSGGLVFITDKAATLSYQGGSSASTTVTVTAADSGEKYNGATGSLSGAPSNVSASFVGSSSGGTTKIVKVVSDDDIERAKGDLLGKSSDDEKKALIKKFTNGEIVIDSSFTAEAADPVATPALNQEAPDGKGSLTVSTTYSIQAVEKSVLDTYLKDYLSAKIDKDNTQKVYNTGVDKASLTSFQKSDAGMTATIIATGSVGPKIDEAAIKDQVKGKIYGEVQQSLQAVNGIKDVDVKFSYFWVRKVPNDPNKITIEFKVDSANGK